MTKKVLVPVADGTEELEAVSIIDILRRAGAEVTVASVGALQITASRGLRIVADALIGDLVEETFDLIVLPGGLPGVENLRDSKELERMLRGHVSQNRLYGAICAAPVAVLKHHGLIGRHLATAHPALAGQLDNQEAVETRVVSDGKLVTSRGAGTAVEFALKLVEELFGRPQAEEVARAIVAA